MRHRPWKGDGEYVWVRVTFSRADVFYNISNCYAKVWVPSGTDFPPGDRFLCLEEVVLPISSEEGKRAARGEGPHLVALKNMPRTFPGTDGCLYVNHFQVASIMTLDANSELITDLERIARVRAVEKDPSKRGEAAESSVVHLEAHQDS